MTNEFLLVVVCFAYLLLKELIWTYKEIQLIDRSLPRDTQETKVRWFVAQMRELLKKSKKVPRKKSIEKPPPIVDNGEKEPLMGPENPIHKQGVDSW